MASPYGPPSLKGNLQLRANFSSKRVKCATTLPFPVTVEVDMNNLKIVFFMPSVLLFALILLFVIFCFVSSPILLYIIITISFCLVIWIISDIIIANRDYKGELDIKTPEGFDQPFHPSVVYIQNNQFKHKYYMAFTPYPKFAKPYTDRWENPTIICSEDGINWDYPGDCVSIDDLTEEQIKNKDFFSDPHLIYNDSLNRLECFYRLSSGACPSRLKKVTLFRKHSYDGINWSERETLSFNIIS